MAKLYFHYSTMNAGKSTALLQANYNYHERGMNTLVLVASLENRTGKTGIISSRIGIQTPAHTFTHDENLYTKVVRLNTLSLTACIFIDEAQWLTEAQVWQLTQVVDQEKIPVMTYGLRVDFKGELFTGSKALLALADELRELRTICYCGKKATMVIRKDAEGKALTHGPQILVGGNDAYESLCRIHWKEAIKYC
jgi:thymidine kinase